MIRARPRVVSISTNQPVSESVDRSNQMLTSPVSGTGLANVARGSTRRTRQQRTLLRLQRSQNDRQSPRWTMMTRQRREHITIRKWSAWRREPATSIKRRKRLRPRCRRYSSSDCRLAAMDGRRPGTRQHVVDVYRLSCNRARCRRVSATNVEQVIDFFCLTLEYWYNRKWTVDVEWRLMWIFRSDNDRSGCGNYTLRGAGRLLTMTEAPFLTTRRSGVAELSMGWVNPRVGLGWVEFFQFFMGWVGLGRMLNFQKFQCKLKKLVKT